MSLSGWLGKQATWRQLPALSLLSFRNLRRSFRSRGLVPASRKGSTLRPLPRLAFILLGKSEVNNTSCHWFRKRSFLRTTFRSLRRGPLGAWGRIIFSYGSNSVLVIFKSKLVHEASFEWRQIFVEIAIEFRSTNGSCASWQVLLREIPHQPSQK